MLKQNKADQGVFYFINYKYVLFLVRFGDLISSENFHQQKKQASESMLE